MNNPAKETIQKAIDKWKSEKRFTFENKQVFAYQSPITEGEYMLRFTNSLNSFFCNQKPINVSITSRPFHTSTLSENPLSENPNADANRLAKIFEEFDNEFYSLVEKELTECMDKLTTSDPLFLK